MKINLIGITDIRRILYQSLEQYYAMHGVPGIAITIRYQLITHTGSFEQLH